MADYNSSLPVRTQNNGDIVAFIADATTPTQLNSVDTHGSLSVLIKNASGTATTSQANGAQQALDVGINVAGVQVDPRSVGQYNSTLPTVTSGSNTPLQTNANGILLTAAEPDLMPATVNITAQDTASTSTAEYNQTWYSGAPTAGSAASFAVSSQETVIVEITGTWTGTLQFEVSVDGGTNWIAHAVHLLGGPLFLATVTGNAMASINVAAKTNFRVRSTATWTGTATVKINESLNSSSIYVANSLKLVDGSTPTSTTLINILAASTAAAASNTAVVVALSPNSPLPAGSALIGAVNIEASGTALTATGSSLNVNLTNASVAVTQGTSPWVTSDLADGSATGGTAGTKSLLAGLIYNTAAPVLTNGQQVGLQGDVSGNLKVNLQTAIPAGTNLIGKIEINDGTANIAAIAPASTAAASTQASLVVALSPNSPLPAGTAVIGAVNQGTSPWITSDLADGSATGGTAGTKSLLAGGIYNTALPTLTNGQQVGLQTDSSGRLLVGSIASALPAGSAIIGKVEITDGTNTVGVAPASTAATATQPAEVVALSPNSPLPAGTNALGSVLANIQVANAPVTTANPVPVTISDMVPGTPVQYYNTSVALAAGASATFTYTVAASHTFTLQRFWASASGKIKVVCANNGSTIYVGFNSTANPNIDITVITAPTIAAGNTVTMTITNDDKSAMDVYGTIEGNQN